MSHNLGEYPLSKGECFGRGHTSDFIKRTPICPLCGMTEWEETCGNQTHPREFTVGMLETIRRIREEHEREEAANNSQFGVGA